MKLRQYQAEAVESIYDYFESVRQITDGGRGNPLIVLPTGSGKSYVQAAFVRGVLEQWPGQRFLLLTHVKELLQQNGAELVRSWPEAEPLIGYYSAGLGKRNTDRQITIAGIQSVYRRAPEFGAIDLVMIDEAHLVPKKGLGMYRQFLDALSTLNPKLKVIGMTATPYRLDSGLLHQGEGAIFSDICYDTDLKQLIADGYLAPLVTKLGKERADLRQVGTRGGEYIPGQLERAMLNEGLVEAAVAETIQLCEGRSKWLVFCSGVKHAENVRDEFGRRGVIAACITGDTPKADRDAIIRNFKAGRIRALTNVNVLTTGFNVPNIDAMIVLRPTKSTGLHVQMMGRGMRPAPEKSDTLILDFTRNILDHGPLDKIKVNTKTGEIETEPQRECPECRAPMPAKAIKCPCGYEVTKTCRLCRMPSPMDATECVECGYSFVRPSAPKHNGKPMLGAAVMSSNTPDWLEVDSVSYRQHNKPGKPPSLRVARWICGGEGSRLVAQAGRRRGAKADRRRPRSRARPARATADYGGFVGEIPKDTET
jgi:DNA repair protein RadD